MDQKVVEQLIQTLLKEIGEDPEREGLVRTPARVAEAYEFLVSGYSKSLEEELNGAVFQSESREMVLVRDIDFYSLCEHHMLPFFGRIHIAYIPNEKIIGLSKLARIVELFSRRLQVQERLTTEIAQCLDDVLAPKGVAVIARAQHLCMMMRGVQKQNSQAVTSEMIGAFRNNPATRSELLSLVSI